MDKELATTIRIDRVKVVPNLIKQSEEYKCDFKTNKISYADGFRYLPW